MRKMETGWIILLLLCGISALAQEESGPVITRDSFPDPDQTVVVEVMNGFIRPIYLTHAGDQSGRLFIVEQGGIIHVTLNGVAQDIPFLDVSSLLTWDVHAGGYTERGLLGLAFHPDYAQNGEFFIHYSDKDGGAVIARYLVSLSNPNIADPDSAQIIFSHPQPFANHNGGQIAFGPDGYLYISLGDGGSANDPLGSGQNLQTLLGSILRLDVDGDAPYAIPEDNPFVGDDTGADEIWAYGLRNAWRFSFDSATGDLYIADVGQILWEEINFQPADSPGGENYGWNAFEATHVFRQNIVAPNAIPPIAEYSHDSGCSVTGGYVYRGTALPDLQGVYFYGDWCTGIVWAAYRDEQLNWHSDIFLRGPWQISSFGEDESGELYIVNHGGNILRINPVE